MESGSQGVHNINTINEVDIIHETCGFKRFEKKNCRCTRQILKAMCQLPVGPGWWGCLISVSTIDDAPDYSAPLSSMNWRCRIYSSVLVSYLLSLATSYYQTRLYLEYRINRLQAESQVLPRGRSIFAPNLAGWLRFVRKTSRRVWLVNALVSWPPVVFDLQWRYVCWGSRQWGTYSAYCIGLWRRMQCATVRDRTDPRLSTIPVLSGRIKCTRFGKVNSKSW